MVVGKSYETFNRGSLKVGRIVKIEPYVSKKDTSKTFYKAKIGFGKQSPDRYANTKDNLRIYIMEQEKGFLRECTPFNFLSDAPHLILKKSFDRFTKQMNHLIGKYKFTEEMAIQIAKSRFIDRPFTVEDLTIAMYETLVRKPLISYLDHTISVKPVNIRTFDCLLKATRDILHKCWMVFDPLSHDTFMIVSDEDEALRREIDKALLNTFSVVEFTKRCRLLKQYVELKDSTNEKAKAKAVNAGNTIRHPQSYKEDLRTEFAIYIKALLLYIRQGNRSWNQPFLGDSIHRALLYPLRIGKSKKDALYLLSLLGVSTDVEPVFYVSSIEGNKTSGVSLPSLDIDDAVEQHAIHLVNVHMEQDYEAIDVDHSQRIDYSHMHSYAIDDITTTEVDDCFSVDPVNKYKVYIHIADPTTILTPHSPLDLDARKRVTSVYLPHMRRSMIPKIIGKEQFTLRNDYPNRGLTFSVTLNPVTGKIDSYDISVSRFRQMMRISYEVADEMINSTSDAEHTTALKNMYHLAELRKKGRDSTNLSLPNFEVRINPDGIEVKPEIPMKSQSLVEEMMILCGEVAATMALQHKIDIPFRHCKAILSAGETSESLTLNESLRRLLVTAPATTGMDPLPHIPMGLPHYTRASSPIRRYTDIIVHHQLKSYLRGGIHALPFKRSVLEHIVKYVDSTEKSISKLQKDSERYWKEQYLIGMPSKKWKAAVLLIDQPYGPAIKVSGELDQRVKLYIYEVGLIVNLNTFGSIPTMSLDEDIYVEVVSEGGKIVYNYAGKEPF